ncbi:hypothetical protein L1887_46217 [Cichorium endivia]|nr:hypothetical protein L1887_46217 [Cichorium endivia]
MGFPSPAADYVEDRISLDKRLIAHPSATSMRYRTLPHPCLENPDDGRREPLPSKDEVSDTSRPVFGVITYSINDARSGEFDDCPVM